MLQGMRKPKKQPLNFSRICPGNSLLSLVAFFIISTYYFVWVWKFLPGEEDLPDETLRMAIIALVFISVVEAAFQTVSFINAGEISVRMDRKRKREIQAAPSLCFSLMVSVLTALAALFTKVTPLVRGKIVLLAYVLEEIDKYSSAIVYNRRAA